MPMYSYKCAECGADVERFFNMGQSKSRVKCACGAIANRDIAADFRHRRTYPNNYPMESDAAGVLPSQADEAYKESVKRGVPTQFNKETGCAIFESKGHRKRYCEAVGLFDRNGGYSDPQKRR